MSNENQTKSRWQRVREAFTNSKAGQNIEYPNEAKKEVESESEVAMKFLQGGNLHQMNDKELSALLLKIGDEKSQELLEFLQRSDLDKMPDKALSALLLKIGPEKGKVLLEKLEKDRGDKKELSKVEKTLKALTGIDQSGKMTLESVKQNINAHFEDGDRDVSLIKNIIEMASGKRAQNAISKFLADKANSVLYSTPAVAGPQPGQPTQAAGPNAGDRSSVLYAEADFRERGNSVADGTGGEDLYAEIADGGNTDPTKQGGAIPIPSDPAGERDTTRGRIVYGAAGPAAAGGAEVDAGTQHLYSPFTPVTIDPAEFLANIKAELKKAEPKLKKLQTLLAKAQMKGVEFNGKNEIIERLNTAIEELSLYEQVGPDPDTAKAVEPVVAAAAPAAPLLPPRVGNLDPFKHITEEALQSMIKNLSNDQTSLKPSEITQLQNLTAFKDIDWKNIGSNAEYKRKVSAKLQDIIDERSKLYEVGSRLQPRPAMRQGPPTLPRKLSQPAEEDQGLYAAATAVEAPEPAVRTPRPVDQKLIELATIAQNIMKVEVRRESLIKNFLESNKEILTELIDLKKTNPTQYSKITQHMVDGKSIEDSITAITKGTGLGFAPTVKPRKPSQQTAAAKALETSAAAREKIEFKRNLKSNLTTLAKKYKENQYTPDTDRELLRKCLEALEKMSKLGSIEEGETVEVLQEKLGQYLEIISSEPKLKNEKLGAILSEMISKDDSLSSFKDFGEKIQVASVSASHSPLAPTPRPRERQNNPTVQVKEGASKSVKALAAQLGDAAANAGTTLKAGEAGSMARAERHKLTPQTDEEKARLANAAIVATSPEAAKTLKLQGNVTNVDDKRDPEQKRAEIDAAMRAFGVVSTTPTAPNPVGKEEAIATARAQGGVLRDATNASSGKPKKGPKTAPKPSPRKGGKGVTTPR